MLKLGPNRPCPSVPDRPHPGVAPSEEKIPKHAIVRLTVGGGEGGCPGNPLIASKDPPEN